VFSSNNNHHDCKDPSHEENQNWDIEKLVAQGDAIYDYERVPAVWHGCDEQPSVFVYGDAASEQENSEYHWRTSSQ
jgi:hypothetical protein